MSSTPNPYQPPPPIEAEAAGFWTRLKQSLRSLFLTDVRRLMFLDDVDSVATVMSGHAFIEYGVVFAALQREPNRFFAAVPVASVDAECFRRNTGEVTRVLRSLVDRIDGLRSELAESDLVISFVRSYRDVATEVDRIVVPAAQWMPADDSDDLYFEIPEYDWDLSELQTAADDEAEDRTDQQADGNRDR